MVIVFTGHRDLLAAPEFLQDLLVYFPGSIWRHGGAPGFDLQVNAVGKAAGLEIITTRPDYSRYAFKVAPLKRNELMIDEMNPQVDFLVALFDGRQRGGTYRTINYARKKGISILFAPPLIPGLHHHKSKRGGSSFDFPVKCQDILKGCAPLLMYHQKELDLSN